MYKEKRGPMFKLYKTPIIVAVVMLFLALLDLPIGYYTLLRIVVCGTAIYLSFVAKEIKKLHWVWIIGFIGILFNPFIPIHMDKEIWAFIDIIVGFTFIIVLLVFIDKKKWAWIVGGTIFFITFLIFSISYFEEKQAKLAQQERWELLDRERKEAQRVKEEAQRAKEEEARQIKIIKEEKEKQARQVKEKAFQAEQQAKIVLRDTAYQFSFQNQDFKITVLQPYWGMLKKIHDDGFRALKEYGTEPHIIFEFDYEIINENKLFDFRWNRSERDILGFTPYAYLHDNFKNSYYVRYCYHEGSQERGRFGFGHKGRLVFATKEKPVSNATHLYLEIPYRHSTRVPKSLMLLLSSKRFEIPRSFVRGRPDGSFGDGW
jgi:uncharacterized membrane protein